MKIMVTWALPQSSGMMPVPKEFMNRSTCDIDDGERGQGRLDWSLSEPADVCRLRRTRINATASGAT